MKRCKDCKGWIKTSDIPNDPNPSGKCNGRNNDKYEGWGIHAEQLACKSFIPKTGCHKSWKFWRPK